MKMIYRPNGVTADAFLRLRHLAGWGGDLGQSELSIQRGLYNIAAICGDEVIGMGRLVGDGVMYWYVQDVIVHPEYQGRGIGKEMMQRLVAYATAHSLKGSTITLGLMSALGKEGFYEKLGFRARPNDREGAGMIMNVTID